jgi:lambda repressor-like predicted transcriptional regulator
MARPERPVDRSNPVLAELADRLRTLRRAAGAPGYRQMADASNCSCTQLAAAASGERLPTWSVTCSYVRACGGDEVAWERYRTELSAYIEAGSPGPWHSSVPGDALTTWSENPFPPGRALATPARPRATGHDSIAAFCADLKRQLFASGLSMRKAAESAGYGASTLSNNLDGSRLPSWDLTVDLLTVLDVPAGQLHGAWKDRWSHLRGAERRTVRSAGTRTAGGGPAPPPPNHRAPICSRCGSRMRRSQPAAICDPCQRTERFSALQAPIQDRDFWTEPQMLTALAALDLSTVCRLYRARTPYCRQQQLAELLGYSQVHISRIERRWCAVRFETVLRFVRCLRIPADLLGAGAPIGRGTRPASDEPFLEIAAEPGGNPDWSHRSARNAGSAAALIGLAQATGTADPRPPVGPVLIGDVHADQISAIADHLYRMDYQFGGDTLCDQATAQLAHAQRLLRTGRYNERVGQRLLAATGELGVCAGWLAFDAGRHQQARRIYTEALTTARIADEPWVEVHALVSMSMQAVALDRPREGLQLAHAAHRALRQRPQPVIEAVVAMREARAWAKLGDARHARAAITRAHAALETPDGHHPALPEWTLFLDTAELAGNEGMCEVDLQRLSAATRLLHIACGHQRTGMTRNRSLYTVRLAAATLARRDITRAVEIGEEALGLAVNEVTSTRIVNELRAFRHQLGRNGQSSRAGRAFTGRFDLIVA